MFGRSHVKPCIDFPIVKGGREQSPEKPRIFRERETVSAPRGRETNLNWSVRGWPLPSIHV